MDPSFLQHLYKNHRDSPGCPSPRRVAHFFVELLGILFPNFSEHHHSHFKSFELHVGQLQLELYEMILAHAFYSEKDAEEANKTFFARLPKIYEEIKTDLQAMFKGDPAAKSPVEVVRSYPGFYAIAAYRIAHELNGLGVKIIPRMITEHAHSQTGIDIHPGAIIGPYFCIDHGTGIVIGETSVIGKYVKIYQGVTLGALSVRKEDAEIKRHPTIEDHVVIYAGSTILGGQTVIGHHSVIGGNVWLTESVPPHSKVYYQAQMSNRQTGKKDLLVYKHFSK